MSAARTRDPAASLTRTAGRRVLALVGVGAVAVTLTAAPASAQEEGCAEALELHVQDRSFDAELGDQGDWALESVTVESGNDADCEGEPVAVQILGGDDGEPDPEEILGEASGEFDADNEAIVDFTEEDNDPIAVAEAMGARVGLADVDEDVDPTFPPGPPDEIPPDAPPDPPPEPEVPPVEEDPPEQPVEDPPPDEPGPEEETVDEPVDPEDDDPTMEPVDEAAPEDDPDALAFTGLPLTMLGSTAGLLALGGLALIWRGRVERGSGEGGLA